jgi:hypothetical protein
MLSDERKERALAAAREWKRNNQDLVKKMRREYYLANKEKELKQHREWKAANPDLYKQIKAASDRKYRQENAEYLEQKRIAYGPRRNSLAKQRYHSDERARAEAKTRARFVQLILKVKSKSKVCEEMCGCDLQSLRKHIESKFLDGMSWDNYGRWHIDHIKPVSSFDLTDQEQIKQCFHFLNLQPLWAADNIKKRNSTF